MHVNRNLLMGIAIGMTVTFLLTSFNVVHRVASSNQMLSNLLDSNSASDTFTHRHALNDDVRRSMSSGDDKHFHTDNDKVAQALAKKIRVLIWVMTAPKNLKEKATTVKETWGKRVDKLIFFSSETDKDFPTVGLNVSEGREHLTAKTMRGFKYVYDHHFNDADWFMKADDDTFVIIENLRYFLSNENHSEPVYFGHHFKTIVKQGYYSGGGGYVLSKEALRRLATTGMDAKICRQDGGAEDAELGLCMERMGVKTANSTDLLGRSRFHCFDPQTHLFGGYPNWYYQYDANGAKKGEESISDYAISFHYVPPKMMKSLEFYIYHLRPYGIQSGDQALNVRHNGEHLK